MFKFGFSEYPDEETLSASRSQKEAPKTTWLPSHQILPNKNDKTTEKVVAKCKTTTIPYTENMNLTCLASTEVLNILKNTESWNTNLVSSAEENHSDLVPAIYEGGLKIWECTYDIIDYIHNKGHIPLNGTNILDLGCGAGIIGLSCLVKNASCTFQDYNSDVIKYVTIPNIILNSEKYLEKSKFFCGDWDSFVDTLTQTISEEDKFDYIFTSETIYNPDNYFKLHKVFNNLLKKNGRIYLAAKSYYFGVGGGIPFFTEYLDTQNVFSYSVCWNSPHGVKREILEIQYKK